MSRFSRTPQLDPQPGTSPAPASARPAVTTGPGEPISNGDLVKTPAQPQASQPAPRPTSFSPPSVAAAGEPSSAPPAANQFWSSWGVVRPDAGWQLQACPKCAHRAERTSDVLTAYVHSDGWIWCGACGFHGKGTDRPGSFRDSWMTVWRVFLKDPAHDTTPPTQYLDTPAADGCWAQAFRHDKWAVMWHAFCRMEENKEIDDALIYDHEHHQWFRPQWPTATPLGWDKVLSERCVLVASPDDQSLLIKAGVTNVVCLPPDLSSLLPNAPAWRVLETMEAKMKTMTDIVIALPSSANYRALEDELGRRLNRERCYRVRWRPNAESNHEELSAKETLLASSMDTLRLLVDTAPPFPVVGVYELDDIDDRFEALYEFGLTPGATTGWPLMDQHYTVKTGQWTVITGIPGHGKSSWLDALLVNLASIQGWRIGMFSPENQPIERHFASLMEKALGAPFSEGPTPRITVEQKNATKRWLNDRFKVILPDEENGVWTLDAVLKLAKILVYRYGIRGLVIDPWNELDHSRGNQTRETDHISEALTQIRRFARLYDVHVWIVAHPTKLEPKADGQYPVATPYNISGGAHWRNKADNALSIYRHVSEPDSDVCDIHVQKIRFKEIGRLGVVSLRCETVTGRYIDDIDQAKRGFMLSKGDHQPSSSMRLRTPRAYPVDHQNIPYATGSSFDT